MDRQQMERCLEQVAAYRASGQKARVWAEAGEGSGFADGSFLSDSQVENLVNAMASYAPPPLGQTTLPSDYAVALVGVIDANWQ